MKKRMSLKKEIVLLFVGAAISISSALITNLINNKKEERRFNIQKKLELNDQISKDLGSRLFLTFELHRSKRDSAAVVAATALSRYKQAKEDWNLKIYSYLSLINYYYGPSMEKEFYDSIYEPLVWLGQKAEYNIADSISFEEDYAKRIDKNINFISKIYRKTEE